MWHSMKKKSEDAGKKIPNVKAVARKGMWRGHGFPIHVSGF